MPLQKKFLVQLRVSVLLSKILAHRNDECLDIVEVCLCYLLIAKERSALMHTSYSFLLEFGLLDLPVGRVLLMLLKDIANIFNNILWII